MKKVSGLAVAIMLIASYAVFADDLSMDTTALDKVEVIYGFGGTVALLGMVDNDLVSLALNGGTYNASEPGAQAILGNGAGAVVEIGGRLHFTAYGIADQKITVQKDSGSPDGYVEWSLGVMINHVGVGGSAIETLGLYPNGVLSIRNIAQTLIQGISGVNTWTGTAKTHGAQVLYELKADPGVTRVDVLYTMVAN